MTVLKSRDMLFDDLINFIYPAYCVDCGCRLEGKDIFLCPKCFDALPKYFGMESYYDAQERLEGLVPFTEFQTDLIFSNPSVVRTLIHNVKYNGFPKTGYHLAKHFAQQHYDAGHFLDVTVIVPVPLLKKRLHRRGYNQSTFIAKGLAEVYSLPIDEILLARGGGRGTQTHRGKEARWQQIQGAFYSPQKSKVSGKRILVVDDVLTTGATLVNAGRALIDAGAESVSFYTLALDVLV